MIEAGRPRAGLGEVGIVVAHGRVGVWLLILVRMMLEMEPVVRICVSGNALVSFVWRMESWRGAGAGYRFEEGEDRGGLLRPWGEFLVDAVAKNTALTALDHRCMGCSGDPEKHSVVETRVPLEADFFHGALPPQAYITGIPLHQDIPNSNFSQRPTYPIPLLLLLIFLFHDFPSSPSGLFRCARFPCAHGEVHVILHRPSEIRVCGGLAHIGHVSRRNRPDFDKRA